MGLVAICYPAAMGGLLTRANIWTWPMLVIVLLSGCGRKIYDPQWATRPYPAERHTTTVADMQVIRRGERMEIVNSTATSYRDFDLWINQRYTSHVESLPAGQTIALSLWDFKDEFGDRFYAGGFFRTRKAQPLRLVEIEPAGGGPMIGLITIRAEPVEVKLEPGR